MSAKWKKVARKASAHDIQQGGGLKRNPVIRTAAAIEGVQVSMWNKTKINS